MNPNQLKRTVIKGAGKWVEEVLTEPTTGVPIKITAFTKAQLLQEEKKLDESYDTAKRNLREMLGLLEEDK